MSLRTCEREGIETHIFIDRLAEHFDDITAFGVCCAKAFCPADEHTMVDAVLAIPRD